MRPISSPPARRQRRPQVAAGDRQHAVGQRGQARDQVAIDVAPHDQAGAKQAEQHHPDHDARTPPLRRERLLVGGADILLGGADQAVQGIADLARQDDVLGEQALRLADDRQLLLARSEDALGPVREAAELLDAFEQARPELGIELVGQRFQRGERAAQRKREQRQVGRGLGARSFQQGVVDRRQLDLGLLLRHERRHLVGQVAGGGTPGLLVDAGIADRAPILGQLGIHDQHAGRDQPLRGDVGAGQPAQQLVLALGHLEPTGDQAVERREIALQALDRGRDRGERVGARWRRCP